MSTVPPGTRWQLSEYLSPARLDRKTILHDTAANLDALTDIPPNMAVIATTSNSNWTADVLYIRNSANTSWISASGGIHLHNSSSPASGGFMRDIILANQENMAWDNMINPNASDFSVETGSAGTIANDPANARVTFNAPTPSGTWVAGARYGVAVSFDSKSKLMVRMMVNAANWLTARVGVVSERVEEVANGVLQKYGIEVCDSAGNNMDWTAYTADGANRHSQTLTGNSVATGAQNCYKMVYTPGVEVRYFKDGSQIAIKTQNVPLSGGIVNSPRNIGVGIRTNTGAARTLYLTGLSYSGRINSSTWS